MSHENEVKYNKQEIGKELEVLWEEQDGKFLKGHTTNYKVVKIPYKPLENTISKVTIEKVEGLELIGK